MIKWSKPTTEEAFPKPGERVIIKLVDGRIFGATINDTLGIDQDFVDGVDILASAIAQNFEFYKLP